MTRTLIAALLTSASLATPAFAAPEAYVLDSSHSQIVFSYNHLGMSTTYGMFSGFEGEIVFDQEDPAASSVSVSMPTSSMLTGWEGRFNHFMGDPKYLGAHADDLVTFSSTGIEVTGDNTALITGDLTLNGVTKSVVLDAVLNGTMDEHPMAGKPWAGFDANFTFNRSEFNMAEIIPFISDEVEVMISIEAMKAE